MFSGCPDNIAGFIIEINMPGRLLLATANNWLVDVVGEEFPGRMSVQSVSCALDDVGYVVIVAMFRTPDRAHTLAVGYHVRYGGTGS